MLFVMDESGDTGLKLSPGQCPWLVVGGALFASRADAMSCRVALAELHRKIGGGEFRFAKNTGRRRRLVLGCLGAATFRYFAVACDKRRLNLARWRKPSDLRTAIAGQLATLVAPELTDCSVWFDTLGGRDVDREFGKHLQRTAGKLPSGKARIMEWKALDSEREVLIQVADYVCGAVSRSVRSTDQEPEYRRMILEHEGEVRFWPTDSPDDNEEEMESGPH